MNRGLVEMLRYNLWANETLFEACRSLTDDQLDHQLPVTSGSSRELLVHIVGGQQTYVLRTHGRQHEGEMHRQSPWPGIDDLIVLARDTSLDLVSIGEDLDPEREVDLPYEGQTYRYPVRFFLVHAVEHGVEHRTEVKLNLADAGVPTPDLDGWEYSDWAGYGAAVTP